MPKVPAVVTALILALCLAVSVSAVSGASQMQNQTVVSSDGACQVSVSMTLELTSAVTELEFPLPANAGNISVNGTGMMSRRSGSFRVVDLSRVVRGLTGSVSLTVYYSLPNSVAPDSAERLILTLPLLSGFAYPISNMSFTVTMPGEITGRPTFSSGYRLSSIEEDIHCTVEGAVISGQVTKELMDWETLTMYLEVSQEMFPQQTRFQWQAGIEATAMYICAGLAFLYWLVFLRCLPPARLRCSTPPEGMTAGEVGSALTCQGADLTMMVMTWARLGYLLIHAAPDGRVYLHKRMEMGNERDAFENRCFRALFGKRQMVEGTGYAYAFLAQRIAAEKPRVGHWFRRGSGNPRIFRFLAALAGLFGGVSLAFSIVDEGLWAGLLAVFLAAVGAVSSWWIQKGPYRLYLYGKDDLLISLICCAGWVILGAIAEALPLALLVAAAELLAGLAAAYGGRRSEQGRLAQAQVLGLRRYLRTAGREDIRQICRTDPEYFFSLAPYALALDVGKAFAGRFGPMRLPGCPYLTTGLDGHRTAKEWVELMAKTVAAMEAKRRRLPLDRALAFGYTVTGGRSGGKKPAGPAKRSPAKGNRRTQPRRRRR